MLQGLHDQNVKHPSLVQKNVTRTKGLFASFQTKICCVLSRYWHSYQAMLALNPSQQLSPGWMQRFKKLEDANVRGPGCDSDDRSEGTFQPSWIWLVPRMTGTVPNLSTPTTNPPDTSVVTANPPDMNVATTNPMDMSITTTDLAVAEAGNSEVAESMRVHWARCQARADWYKEEVSLIVKEMDQTLRYFEWRKSWWYSLQHTREQSASPPPIEVCHGLHAYSSRQAFVY